MRKIIVLFVFYLLLSACSKKEESMPGISQVDLAYSRLEFQCAHEVDVLPILNSSADILYRYGVYLEKLKGKKNYSEIARYYRIAAAHEHFKAATNLQLLLSTGQAESPDAMTETIDLVEFFIARKIPGAFYDMGHYLELGYGVKQDVASSRAYFRRAADMGSPDAQYYVGRLLSEVQNAEGVTLDMYKCAMEQGNRMAARDYSNYSKFIGMYAQSLLGYQQAVRNGDDISANRLTNAFQGPLKSDRIYYLALEKDSERVERYRKISEFLSRHEHLGAKIPDLDDIVPLPPAALPEWDGTFKWQRDRDAYVPVIPSQELIEKLSAEKRLDPATGLPLPGVKN
jgi:uncharacterized protein